MLARLTTKRWSLLLDLGALGVVLVLSAYRLYKARWAEYPGRADPSFYVGVARSIRDGHGPYIDYVWQFLAGEPALHHFAFDYWLPLPSYLMAGALWMKDSMTAVLAVGIALSALLALATWLLARSLTSSAWVPPMAAVLVGVLPGVSKFAVQAEAPMYMAPFAVLALWACVKAVRHPWMWLAAGAFAAVANLARNEGLLVLGIALLVACASGSSWRSCAARVGLVLAPYVVVMLPLFVAELREYGSLLPPASSAFPYIHDVEDLYALHVEKSLSTLVTGSFVIDRISTFDQGFTALFEGIGVIPAVPLMVFACIVFWDRKWRVRLGAAARGGWSWALSVLRNRWFAPVGFLLLVLLFEALAAPAIAVLGAQEKVSVSTTPILVVAGLTGLSFLVRRPWAVAVLCAAMLAFPLVRLVPTTEDTIAENNRTGQFQTWAWGQLDGFAQCYGEPVVIMDRLPWDLNYVTGYQAVMIPNGSWEDIVAVAERYGAVLIDADTKGLRTALNDLDGLVADGLLWQPPSLGGTGFYRFGAQGSGLNPVC